MGREHQDYNIRNVAHIVDVVSTFYGVTASAVYGDRRPRTLVRARHVCMYFARVLLGFSYPEISRAFGRRDHTTAMEACKKLERDCTKDERLNREIEDLLSRVQGNNLYVSQMGTSIHFPEKVWERLKAVRASEMFGKDMDEVVIRLVSIKLYELEHGTTEVRNDLHAASGDDEPAQYVQPPSSRLRHHEP